MRLANRSTPTPVTHTMRVAHLNVNPRRARPVTLECKCVACVAELKTVLSAAGGRQNEILHRLIKTSLIKQPWSQGAAPKPD